MRWSDRHLDSSTLHRLPRVRDIAQGSKPLSADVARFQGHEVPGERRLHIARGRQRRLAPAASVATEKITHQGKPTTGTWRGSQAGVIEIVDNGTVERVTIDKGKGPQLYKSDGTIGHALYDVEGKSRSIEWENLPPADQKLLVYKAVRRNRSMVEWRGEEYWHPELVMSPEEKRAKRCGEEWAKPTVKWRFISIEDVTRCHKQRAPGLIYGMEFPWTEAMLEEFGPEWLTRAMHAAGTLDQRNRVTSLVMENTIKVTGGNNAGKFLFEVTYAKPDKNLHTELFAKVPFQMTKETQTDRISSSVYKQPMDLQEINTYRLLEASLPVATPKYYFGDISNTTSNFILITARIPFTEHGGFGGPLPPFEVEGPYDKCKDWQLKGEPREYYELLMQATGKIAGAHKSGIMGSDDLLAANYFNRFAERTTPEAWGINPWGSTVPDPGDCCRKLEQAYRFISQIARPLFPEYAATEEFKDKFMRTMMMWNAYQAEIEYWKICYPDYVALGHMNLNADNAYYWRDMRGQLDCGLIDWGGFGISNVGHKLWWILNCADFEHVLVHLSDYITTFVSEYQKAGGPVVDTEIIRRMIILTSLGNTMFMVGAVPNCYNMCSAAEFASITDRNDPRIAENIHGKSTLRTTLHVLNSGIRVIGELKADETLEAFVREIVESQWGLQAKSEAIIYGKPQE